MQSSFLRGTAKLDRDRAKAREREGAWQLPACTAELDRDRAKAREREGAWQLPACTAELDRDRAKAREQEGAWQLPACTAELDRDRAEAESRKVEKKKKKAGNHMRVGMGYDVHKLVEGRKLIIGGVEIPHSLGLLGHSDADVLLHAIMDALLGAAALGDIGKHFPDTDPAYEGISSIKLLEEVGQLLEKENYVIDNIDATIIAQKPKMRPHIEKMEENIAQALKIDVSQVNVKATTEEGLGFTGSEDGISSQAICAISSIYENSIAVGGSERNCAGCPGCGK